MSKSNPRFSSVEPDDASPSSPSPINELAEEQRLARYSAALLALPPHKREEKIWRISKRNLARYVGEDAPPELINMFNDRIEEALDTAADFSPLALARIEMAKFSLQEGIEVSLQRIGKITGYLEKSTPSPKLLLEFGNFYQILGYHGEQLNIHLLAADSNPQGETALSLGMIWDRVDLIHKAIEQGSPQGVYELSNYYNRMNQLEESKNAFKDALRSGSIAAWKKMIEAIIQDPEEDMEPLILPENFVEYVIYAEELAEQGHGPALNFLAYYYHFNGEGEKAIEMRQKCIQSGKYLARSFPHLVGLLLTMGERGQAEAVAEDAAQRGIGEGYAVFFYAKHDPDSEPTMDDEDMKYLGLAIEHNYYDRIVYKNYLKALLQRNNLELLLQITRRVAQRKDFLFYFEILNTLVEYGEIENAYGLFEYAKTQGMEGKYFQDHPAYKTLLHFFHQWKKVLPGSFSSADKEPVEA